MALVLLQCVSVCIHVASCGWEGRGKVLLCAPRGTGEKGKVLIYLARGTWCIIAGSCSMRNAAEIIPQNAADLLFQSGAVDLERYQMQTLAARVRSAVALGCRVPRLPSSSAARSTTLFSCAA